MNTDTPVLKATFQELLRKYTENEQLIEAFWAEITKNYASKNRYYHTLHHLSNLLVELKMIKNEIKNWDAILFTLFYHDLVYNVLKTDNEEKSAAIAEKRLEQLFVPKEIITLCKAHILATKTHTLSSNSDTNFFTDADLSILGQPSEVYLLYSKNVRKEYGLFPDFVYNSGRKKVIHHFLEMEKLFKTDFFYNKFEQKAKENLKNELTTL